MSTLHTKKILFFVIGTVCIIAASISPASVSASSLPSSWTTLQTATPQEDAFFNLSGFLKLFGGIVHLGISSNTTSNPACPKGYGYPDGCAAASVSGNFQDSNFFNDARQSNQAAYLVRAPWNVAGVDYPVGYDKTKTLKDPNVNQAQLPTGCVYDATGASTNSRHTGPTVSCGATASPAYGGGTLNGWDFTKNNCTWLYIGPYATGTTTISNNHFGAGSNCNANISQPLLGTIYANQHINVVFSNNEVEELYSSTTHMTQAINAFSFTNDGTLATPCNTIIQYNYIHDLNGNFAGGNGANCTVQVKYNVENNINLATSSHAAFYANDPTAGTLASPSIVNEYDQQYNVCENFYDGTTCFSILGNEGNFSVYTTANVDHNTIVTNGMGASSQVSAAIAEVLRDYYVTTANFSNNYVDPTGSLSCFTNGGDAQSVTGTINNGSSGAGSTLTVTADSPAFYPYAAFGNPTGDVIYGFIAPIGANSFDTGLPTTGTSTTGTYALCSDQTCSQAASSVNVAFSNWAALSTYVQNLNYSGNVNMLTNNPITIAGVKWSSGACK